MSNIVLQPNASGTGNITIATPNTNTDRTLTIPDVTGNVVTTGDSGTVTGTMIGSLPAGSVIQVVQSVITDHNSSSSASWVATNVFGSITPTYNTSKILVQFTGVIRSYNSSGYDGRTAWRIYKDDNKTFKVTSIITLLGIINVPIIKYSVDWWNTLHQPASINILSKSSIHISMLYPLIIMTAAFALFSLLIFLMKYNTELIKIKNKGLDRL